MDCSGIIDRSFNALFFFEIQTLQSIRIGDKGRRRTVKLPLALYFSTRRESAVSGVLRIFGHESPEDRNWFWGNLREMFEENAHPEKFRQNVLGVSPRVLYIGIAKRLKRRISDFAAELSQPEHFCAEMRITPEKEGITHICPGLSMGE